MEDKKQGLVIMEAPVELRTVHGKHILQLKEAMLTWDSDYMTSQEVETFVNFVKFAYKSGFADGSQTAMNIDKPKQKMFAILPNETGYDSFFVMSDTKENALEAIKLNERYDSYLKGPDKYTITEHELNDSVWQENA